MALHNNTMQLVRRGEKLPAWLKRGSTVLVCAAVVIVWSLLLPGMHQRQDFPLRNTLFSINSETAGTGSSLHNNIDVSTSIPIMWSLSDSSSFMSTVKLLYSRYGSEIAAFRPIMKEWCSATNSCKFTDFEVEMLYMLIRQLKPQKVFEMAPNRGFSTHWILKALTMNDETSRLYSYDIHDKSVKTMMKEFQDRWIFTLGNYEELLEAKKLDMEGFDFIFIDALHTEEFSRGYCKKLLHPHKTKQTVVAIHDIVADDYGGGRESSEVYKYLAFAENIRHVFTVSRFFMPTLMNPIPNAIEELHTIRAAHKIVKPCSGDSCKEAIFDPLYFENNDAPTLFFQLN